MKRPYAMPVLAAAFALVGGAALAGPEVTHPDSGLYPDAPFSMYAANGHVAGTHAANVDAARLMTTSNDPQARCATLQSQFDHAIDAHANAKKVAIARVLRKEGTELCAAGETANGIRKLEQALSDINVAPYKSKG